MTRRFCDGWHREYDGLHLRVRAGRKAPDDLVMEMFVGGEWKIVSMGLVAILTDFLCENEDVLYPPPAKGGDKFMGFLARAKLFGHDNAIQQLEAEKANKRQQEALS